MECARVLVSTSVFASLALGATAAFADDEGLRLAWSAPAGCPTGEDVKAATLRSVDRTKMLSGTLLADATVEQTAAASWRVRLRTQRGDNAGQREIEGPTCAGVADATAVILALALVPPTTIEAPPPSVEPAPPPAETPPKVEAPPEPHHFAAGASYAGSLGSLPKLGSGGAITLAWTPGRLRVEADGKMFGVRTGGVSGGSAELSLKGAGARGCYAIVSSSSFELAPCLGFGLEIMSADGKRTADDRSETRVWASFAGGAFGRVFLTNWLALRGRVEAVAQPVRPNFILDLGDLGRPSVHKPAAVGGAGYFGAEVLFL